MSSAGEVEVPVTEEAKKPTRVKKPPQPKTVPHPPYFQMIKEAISSLSEKNGSSPYAIAKYMEEKHKAVLPGNFRKMLALQLKNFTVKGNLTKIKASYKLSEGGKKVKGITRAAKANAEKKTRQGKTATAAPKRKATKKAIAKKPKKSSVAKPKQPKSIRSPVAKRAKKAAV